MSSISPCFPNLGLCSITVYFSVMFIPRVILLGYQTEQPASLGRQGRPVGTGRCLTPEAPSSIGPGGLPVPGRLLPAARGCPGHRAHERRRAGHHVGARRAGRRSGQQPELPNKPHPHGPASLKGEGKVTGRVGDRRGRRTHHPSIPPQGATSKHVNIYNRGPNKTQNPARGGVSSPRNL